MTRDPAALAATVLRPQCAERLPLDPAEVFPRSGPLGLEIGFGNGEYLAWWAERAPQWNLLGIEFTRACLERAAERVHRAGVSGRVRLLHGDARHVLRETLPPGSVDEAIMQFPMPWPRKRHAKHRVIGPRFRSVLASLLTSGGRFELVTDQDWYADQAAADFASDAGFVVEERCVDPDRPFRTRYERRWLAEGRHVHRLRVRLITPRPLAPLSIPASAMDVHHLPELPSADRLLALVERRHEEGDLVCVVKEVHRSEDGYLLKVLAADPGFPQMFFARVRGKPSAAVLRVEECGKPFLTPAVRMALSHLATELGGAVEAG